MVSCRYPIYSVSDISGGWGAALLQVQHITHIYRGIPALRDVNFHVRAGEVVGCIGNNGAGKSTTVKIITGLIEPTSGQVRFQGSPISDDPTSYRSSFGYVPEEAHLYTHLSGLEYLQLVGRLRRMSESTILARANTFLSLLDLSTWRHSPIALYSKGMKQRVLIAAALLHNPTLLILDEPLSGLDVNTARLFRDLLLALAQDGKAILCISHALEVVDRVCSRIIVLADGAVVADDSPAELRRRVHEPGLNAALAHLLQPIDTRPTAAAIVEAMHAPRI